jgi:hypothetical protein
MPGTCDIVLHERTHVRAAAGSSLECSEPHVLQQILVEDDAQSNN